MRAFAASGLVCTLCLLAGSALAQDSKLAKSLSDSWEKPASASTASYRTTPSTAYGQQNGRVSFKVNKESPYIELRSRQTSNGKPSTLCQQNPTASTCR